VPPGIEDGARLRVTGRGQAGARGGRAGDLYVEVVVQAHEVFRRVGDDLGCEVPVPMTIAALGGTVQVPTLDGSYELTIRPGTQSGEVARLRDLGMPRLGGRGRGELVALLKVETPTDLDSAQVDLLDQLAKLRGEETSPPKGFFDRLKQAFG
jgi:molecular chaperone DnaJ